MRRIQAQSANVHPLYYMLPVALACSYAFMLPAATPPNAIVFGSRLIGAADMVRSVCADSSLVQALAGIGIEVMCVAVCMLNVHTWAWYLFDLSTVPTWANATYIGDAHLLYSQ
jgi:sodium-dependent dicarboxylate transporter 2/3/5